MITFYDILKLLNHCTNVLLYYVFFFFILLFHGVALIDYYIITFEQSYVLHDLVILL